ncbi:MULTISPECIES: right-handed parallel beta-helix repeat-containing protein [unclassified Saccharibacter]|uniref:right-handed parallel beta-helix repeat-containing protein n=1 Tax=unclassified Saccharibacter TaxID=2648722 RepID=UPI001325DD80|nr:MULTISPECIES: right-handed parallel beta-helix repeat-containing protein [unclassified Saccharibacter]MXV35867.1 hypothetical protein [Saccharibacter sp. EH611]MXV57987.1 hypothetical protein [Saccharibacter sp. EH70]MXV66382.1 hypothetical protein [Saccharibacter sp. EH60]
MTVSKISNISSFRGACTTPNWHQDYIPTAIEWNNCWSNKADGDVVNELSDSLQHMENYVASLPSVSLTNLGVIDDPSGKYINENTEAYQSALDNSAGKYRLCHPANLSVVLHNLTITRSDTYWVLDGVITLAAHENKNIVDIGSPGNTISGISITGRGTFNGNMLQQEGGERAVCGGLCANTLSHTDNIPDNPAYPALIRNLSINGITITNVFNWPISLGYIKNSLIKDTSLLNSGNSPQFIWSSDNCWFNGNISSGHTDGGFVFYMGSRKCGAIGNIVHDNHDGIGVYSDLSSNPEDNSIIICDNHVYNNKDSGIGITTLNQNGAETSSLKQKNIIISGNILSNNNTRGRNGGGSIGIVGAYNVQVRGNSISQDGSTTTSGQPVYAIYVSDSCQDIDVSNNTISDIGSPTNLGTAIYLNHPTRTVVRHNTFTNSLGTNGPFHTGIGGTVGPLSLISGNIATNALAGALLSISWPNDTVFLSQPDGLGGMFDNLTRNSDVIASGKYNYNGRNLSRQVGATTDGTSIYLQTAQNQSTGAIAGNIVLNQNGIFREFSLALNGAISTPSGGVLLNARSPSGAPLLLQTFTANVAHGDWVPFPQSFTSDTVSVVIPPFFNGTNMIIGGPSTNTPANRSGFVVGKFWLGVGGANTDIADTITIIAIGELSL